MKIRVLTFTLIVLAVLVNSANAWWSPKLAFIVYSEWNGNEVDAWAKIEKGHAACFNEYCVIFKNGYIRDVHYAHTFKVYADVYKVNYGVLAKLIRNNISIWWDPYCITNTKKIAAFYFGENDAELRNGGGIYRIWVAYDDERISSSINTTTFNASLPYQSVEGVNVRVVDWDNSSKFCFGGYCFVWGWEE